MERALFYSAIRACWFHGIVLTNRPVKLPGIRKWFALRGEGRRTPSLELNRNSVRYIDRQKDFQHLFFCQAKHRGTDVAETLVNGGHRKTFLLLRDSIFLRLRKHHLCAWVLDRSNNSSKKNPYDSLHFNNCRRAACVNFSWDTIVQLEFTAR